MNKNQNSKKHRIIGIVLIVLLLLSCGVSGKLYMDHKRNEEKKAALAYRAERIIARQLQKYLTGITEIDFKYANTTPNGAGDWIIQYQLKTTWDDELDKRDLPNLQDATVADPMEPIDPTAPKMSFKDTIGIDYMYQYEKSSDADDAHSGVTKTPIKVVYTNGKKETLNTNR